MQMGSGACAVQTGSGACAGVTWCECWDSGESVKFTKTAYSSVLSGKQNLSLNDVEEFSINSRSRNEFPILGNNIQHRLNVVGAVHVKDVELTAVYTQREVWTDSTGERIEFIRVLVQTHFQSRLAMAVPSR
jgi:hypothetical protein